MKRFNLSATTHKEAITYIKNRLLQIAHTRVVVKDIFEIPEGIWAKFEYAQNTYYSLYLLSQFRSSDKFFELWTDQCEAIGHEAKMLITSGCLMSQYFKHKQIPFIIVNGLTNTIEYNTIENIYGDKCANRSGVYYMNHINEGLYVLSKLSASLDSKLGFIIHPLFQSDEELRRCYSHSSLNKISPQSIINAVEFRNVINGYSSYRTIKDIDDIKVSPLKDVNLMVTADIIQKRKDFEIYHLGTHKRSDELDLYFRNWLRRLNVGEHYYNMLKTELIELNTEVKLKTAVNE